jgi:hypothetical protein
MQALWAIPDLVPGFKFSDLGQTLFGLRCPILGTGWLASSCWSSTSCCAMRLANRSFLRWGRAPVCASAWEDETVFQDGGLLTVTIDERLHYAY